MDALRQRWHDVAAPKLYKARWFIAFWVVLALVAVPWGVRAQERGLESAAAEALADAGVVVADISFTGRDAVISGELTAADQRKAQAALEDVAGIRSVEWQVDTVVPPPPELILPTTTTTTIPPGEPATLAVKVVAGRIVLRGDLPDAETVASLGAIADTLYSPQVTNRLFVGDVVAPPWLEMADEVIASLGLASEAEVTLDGDGVAGNALVPTDGAAEVLEALFEELRSGDVSVEIEITVDEGDLPVVRIVDDGDGAARLEGALPKRIYVKSLTSLVSAADGRDVDSTMTVDKTLAPTYAMTRLGHLVGILATGDQWALRYENGAMDGERAGNGLWPASDDAGEPSPVGRLVDEIAALMIADPTFQLTIEIGAWNPEDGVADRKLAGQRAVGVGNALMRAGVDPLRVSVAGIEGGELLRFRLEPAER